MAIRTFRTYSDSVEANIALSKLQANAIPCFLTNERVNDLLWHMKVGLGGIQLMVDENDFEKAYKVLSSENTPITDEETGDIICSYCGSNNIKYGPQTNAKLNLVGFLKLLISLIIMTPAPVANRQYHCFNCEKDFDKGTKNKIS